MVKRLIFDSIQKALKAHKSVFILGPRQTGKTTLIESFQPDLSVTFLSNRIRQAYEKDPDLILREIAVLNKKKTTPLVVLDEVQKIPSVMDPIQFLIDKKKAQFIITGSSARKLKQESDLNLLPGRIIYFRMDPFSFQEHQVEDLDQLLYFGSLPEIALLEDAEIKGEILRTYVDVYLEEEIRKEARLKKLPEFFRFMEFAAQKSGEVVSYSKIAQQVGLSHVSVKSYYEILETTLIVEKINPIFQSNTRKKLIKSPRYLFFDLGVRRLAAGEGFPLPNSIKGHLFEQLIGLEIIRSQRQNKSASQLMFWQDPSVGDVDWVIKKGNSFIPIEVKLSDSVNKADARHLSTFLDEYPCPKGGFVIYTGKNAQQLTSNIKAIPWQEFLTQTLKSFR